MTDLESGPMKVLHSALVNISPGLEELLDSEQISLTCSCEEIHHNNTEHRQAETTVPGFTSILLELSTYTWTTTRLQ